MAWEWGYCTEVVIILPCKWHKPLNSIPSTRILLQILIMKVFYIDLTFIWFQELLQCLFNTRLDTHGAHDFLLIIWSTWDDMMPRVDASRAECIQPTVINKDEWIRNGDLREYLLAHPSYKIPILWPVANNDLHKTPTTFPSHAKLPSVRNPVL